MKKDKILYYFTSFYPFGYAEQFIENEIISLSSFYKHVYIIPLSPSLIDHSRLLPSNVSVKLISSIDLIYRKSDLIRYPFLILKVIFSEITRKGGRFALLNLRYCIVEILKAIELSRKIEIDSKVLLENQVELSFYSTWMNEWALALSFLYRKHAIRNFTFKMRGYDLFNERRKNNFMPFRNFIFLNSKQRLSMSQEGVNYLSQMGFVNVKKNYPGIKINQFVQSSNKSVFVLVSCSNIIPLKRVTLIAASLNYIDFPLKWIHFGDGDGMSELKSIVKDLPSNISVELKGRVENSVILDFYSKTKVDAFIHMSLSEGFGYSIIEAFSYGVPAILFPGGAVKELITEQYCLEAAENDGPKEIAQLITKANQVFNCEPRFREMIINECKKKFDIHVQGLELFNMIEN